MKGLKCTCDEIRRKEMTTKKCTCAEDCDENCDLLCPIHGQEHYEEVVEENKRLVRLLQEAHDGLQNFVGMMDTPFGQLKYDSDFEQGALEWAKRVIKFIGD